MRVGVAGGYGFLGRWVCKALADAGHHPIAFSRATGVDLRDFGVASTAIGALEADTVVNCAADSGGIGHGDAATLYENNLLIGYNLARSCLVTGTRLVNILPNIVYPTALTDHAESEWLCGRLDDGMVSIGMARQAMWAQCYAYRGVYDFHSIHLVLPNLFGPGDDHPHALGALVARIVEAKCTGAQTITIWGTGSPIREWGYVPDIAVGIVKAMESYNDIHPLNIGTGEGISITGLAGVISDIVGWDGSLEYDLTKEDGPRRKVLDVGLMKAILDWTPGTGLYDAIRTTVEWYRGRQE